MLQQILSDLYIEPEILAELDEEQKQVLFCKMREEQVRRWKERDTSTEQENAIKSKNKNGTKRIDFLKGRDGNDWVWVMGEHEQDKTIDQILEEEAIAKAKKLAEEEAEAIRKREEAEVAKKLKEENERLEREMKEREMKEKADREAQISKERKEELLRIRERQKEERKKQLHEKETILRRQSDKQVQHFKERRSSELYDTFKEARKQREKLARENSKKLDEDWSVREKKSKAAEQEVRAIARWSRQEHRRSLHDVAAQTKVIGTFMQSLKDVQARERKSVPPRPPPPKGGFNSPHTQLCVKQRGTKPTCKQDVIDWFKEVERPRYTVYTWFHGIITRYESEELLLNKREGTFLVRVSERVWGYAVSYRAKDRCKHFLVDASDGEYHFFGSNQVSHRTMADLVNYHKDIPISTFGNEKLLYACGQQVDPPDFYELVHDLTREDSSYL